MKIGITERGDGGLDLSWKKKCLAGEVQGVIVITKRLTDACINALLEVHNAGFPAILHLGATGYGGTLIEPGTWDYHTQLKQGLKLISLGFPANQIVLRVDPIFPTPKGIQKAVEVIAEAVKLSILPRARIRISLLDEYPHVKKRFKALGFEPIYSERFSCSDEEGQAVENALSVFGLPIETCAEPTLTGSCFEQRGCISDRDIQIMGLECKNTAVNPQKRKGCLCLNVKTELLNNPHPCANNCAYCYWRDAK